MKTITRFVDDLGRIVLPKEYRTEMNITSKTKVLISESDGVLTICIAEPVCKICGCRNNINSSFGLCENCIEKIKAI